MHCNGSLSTAQRPALDIKDFPWRFEYGHSRTRYTAAPNTSKFFKNTSIHNDVCSNMLSNTINVSHFRSERQLKYSLFQNWLAKAYNKYHHMLIQHQTFDWKDLQGVCQKVLVSLLWTKSNAFCVVWFYQKVFHKLVFLCFRHDSTVDNLSEDFTSLNLWRISKKCKSVYQRKIKWFRTLADNQYVYIFIYRMTECL